jgi:hypothetical protein
MIIDGFFQILDGAKVASIRKELLIQLVTLFQGTFKIVTNRHKCGNILPPKNYIVLRQKNPKKKNLQQNNLYVKNCVTF